jgi:predicted transcriptional regulator YheO
MKSDTIQIQTTDEEPPFIQHCVKLVDFLSKVLDEDCELVLLSFSKDKENGQIVAIRNGYISGRKIGDGILAEGREALASHAFRYSNSIVNYAIGAPNGNHLACSTLLLGDNPENPEGMLSINRVVTATYSFESAHQSANQFNQLFEPFFAGARPEPVFMNGPDDLVTPLDVSFREKFKSALAEVTGGSEKEPKNLSVPERISVINVLKKQGVFEMRKAVNAAANFFNLSEPTIYRYIQKTV